MSSGEAIEAVVSQPHVIGIDPGTAHLGVCLMTLDEQQIVTYEANLALLPKQGNKPHFIAHQLMALLGGHLRHPLLVAVSAEQQMRDLWVRVEQSVAALATFCGKRYESAHPFAWKSVHWQINSVKGHEANKLKAIEVVRDTYGVQLSDHCADSVLVAAWLCRKLRREQEAK